MKNSTQRTGLDRNVQGIMWMVLGGMFFSVMVVLIKSLGSRITSFEIVFFRSVIQLAVLGIVFWRIGFSSLRTSRPLLQGLRAFVAVLLINCNFYAFTKLPVAEVTSIGFSRNLFIVLLAVPLLSERLSIHRIMATIIGFIGIIIILRPGQGVFEGAMMFALAGAFLGAVMMIMVRKLTASDSNVVMMTYPSMAIVLATSVPAFIYWITPTSHELMLLLLMSFMGISGQWCIIQAFRLGEATAVAPANYMRIVFATILGYYFFSEIPDIISAAGTLIIVVSNFYLIFYEGRAIKPETGERIPGDVT